MSVKKSCMIFSIILLLIIYYIHNKYMYVYVFFLLKCQTVLMHFKRYILLHKLHVATYMYIFQSVFNTFGYEEKNTASYNRSKLLLLIMVLVVIPSYFKIIGNDRSMEFILSTDHIWTHLVLFAHSVAYGFSLTCIMAYLAKKLFICSV